MSKIILDAIYPIIKNFLIDGIAKSICEGIYEKIDTEEEIKDMVEKINKKINIPILTEGMEGKIIEGSIRVVAKLLKPKGK